MSSISKGSVLHKLAEKAREEDHHEESLILLEKAIQAYSLENDYHEICMAYLGKGLANKHLYLLTKKKKYLNTVKKNVEDALTLAKTYTISTVFAPCYFNLAQAEVLSGNFSKAIHLYKEALIYYQGSQAEHGNYVYHLEEALFRNGQKKEGIEKILAGLQEIETHMNMVGNFEANVWLTGGYLRLAELLSEDNPQEARKLLVRVKGIIQKYDKEKSPDDQGLVIRKRQLKKLIDTLQ